MATEKTVRLVDDLDGSAADTTVRYGWAGRDYEIDLSEKNASAFADAIAPYLRASRRSGAPRRSRNAEVASAATKQDLNAIRSWASENGHSVSTRGRIAGSIVAAYHSAQERVAAVVAGGEQDVPVQQSTPVEATTPPRKTTAKKTTAKKTTAPKTPSKSTATRTVPAKKAAAKKTAAKKTAAKKIPRKRAAGASSEMTTPTD